MPIDSKLLDILVTMRDEDEELVYEKRRAYLGTKRVDASAVHQLSILMAIHLDQFSQVGGFERYTINETGLNLLKEAKR